MTPFLFVFVSSSPHSLWMAGQSVWMRLGREAVAALEAVDTEAAVEEEEEEEADTSVEAEEEVGQDEPYCMNSLWFNMVKSNNVCCV